jgi:hypothetical protein
VNSSSNCKRLSAVRRILEIRGIRRTAQGIAVAAGVPDSLAPTVTVLDAESTPVMLNDPKLAARVKSALIGALLLGAMDPAQLASAKAQGKSLPGPHSSHFEPVPEPTIRTGVTAMTSVAIALLQQ